MTNNETKTTPATTAAIGERLSKAPAQTGEESTDAPKASEPTPIDFDKLSPAQLQQLKAMLNATPDSVTGKNQKPVVELRKYRRYGDDGLEKSDVIIDHKNSYTTLIRDDRANMTSEVLMIPVKFLGSEEWTNIPWKDFIQSDRIKCEVLGSRSETGGYSEGTTISKETGQLVDRKVTTVKTFFTLKLPEGYEPQTIELEASSVNA